MGIPGLDAWCREHQVGSPIAFSAEEPRTLVVDLMNLAHHLAASATPDTRLCVLGGEYDKLAETTAIFAQTLAAASKSRSQIDSQVLMAVLWGCLWRAAEAELQGVSLVCWLDPSRGTELGGGKVAEWEKRFTDALQESSATERYCQGMDVRGSELKLNLPELGIEQVIQTLQQHGAQIRVATGEADALLVTECQATAAFAVVSQDSDFCVLNEVPCIDGIRYHHARLAVLLLLMCVQSFSASGLHRVIGVECGAGTESDSWVPAVLEVLTVPQARYVPIESIQFNSSGVTAMLRTPAEVACALGLEIVQLRQLAVLCGNDFTQHQIESSQVHAALGIDVSGSKVFVVGSVADWLINLSKSGLTLDTCPEWCTLLENCDSLREAVQVSNDFYSCASVATRSGPSDQSELRSAIFEEMPMMQLPRFSLAVHQSRVYWGSSRVAAEPGLDDVTRGARATCYRLLGAEIVTEYIRSAHNPEELEPTVVAASGTCGNLLQVRSLSIEARLNVLCTCVDMYESDTIQQSLLQLPAPVRLSYTTLRYLLSAERGVGLQLCELDCLVGMLVAVYAEDCESLQHRTTPRPQFRQVELQAWFQYTFKAVRALSQLLGLEECLPMAQPQHLFSGSILLHLCSCDRDLWYSLLSDNAKEMHTTIMDSLSHLVVAACPVTLPVPTLFAHAPAPAETAVAPPAEGALPIEENRQMILDYVANHRVTIISGETGCGKSSRVPIMLYENSKKSDVRAKMFVAQPRRIAVHNLTSYTRQGLGMGELVGMRMGGNLRQRCFRDEHRATRIWFVTTGYLVRLLAHHPEEFESHSHLVIDEVHERSIDSDVLCYLVKKLLVQCPHIRVILMSATLHIDLYANYFSQYDPGEGLFVGARRFPVQIVYAESISDVLGSQDRYTKKSIDMCSGYCDNAQAGKDVLSKMGQCQHSLVVSIVQQLEQQANGSSILVFVPGMDDIIALFEIFSEPSQSGIAYKCIAIHSDVPFEEQLDAWEPAAPGELKVIVATNAAESSITLPDVDFVICLGMHKQVQYDHSRDQACLKKTMVSKASATQRAGRTGRVRPGTVFRLYTKKLFDSLPEHEQSEIHRQPLGTTLLRLKMMLEGPIGPVLADLIESPADTHVIQAFRTLHSIGMLTDPSDEGEITKIGSIAATLPIDLSLTRMLCFASRLGCLPDAVVLIASMMLPRMPFKLASPLFHTDPDEYHQIVASHLTGRTSFDSGMYSEPLMMLRLYSAWSQVKHSSFPQQRSWCERHGLLVSNLNQFEKSVANLQRQVGRIMMSNDRVPEPEDFSDPGPERLCLLRCLLLWNNSEHLVKAIIPKSNTKTASELHSHAQLKLCAGEDMELKQSQLQALFPRSCIDWKLAVPRVPLTLVAVKPVVKDFDHACEQVRALVREAEPEVGALVFQKSGKASCAMIWVRHDVDVELVAQTVAMLPLKPEITTEHLRGTPWKTVSYKKITNTQATALQKNLCGSSWEVALLIIEKSSARLEFVSDSEMPPTIKPMLANKSAFNTQWRDRGARKEKEKVAAVSFSETKVEQVVCCRDSAMIHDQHLGVRLMLAAAHGRRRKREKGRSGLALVLPQLPEWGMSSFEAVASETLEVKLSTLVGYEWHSCHEDKKERFVGAVKDECSLMKLMMHTTDTQVPFAVYSAGMRISDGLVICEKMTLLPFGSWVTVALHCIGCGDGLSALPKASSEQLVLAELLQTQLQDPDDFSMDAQLSSALCSLLVDGTTPYNSEAMCESWQLLLAGGIRANPRGNVPHSNVEQQHPAHAARTTRTQQKRPDAAASRAAAKKAIREAFKESDLKKAPRVPRVPLPKIGVQKQLGQAANVIENRARKKATKEVNQKVIFQSNAPAFKMPAGLAAKLEQSVDSPTPAPPPPKLASAKKGTMAMLSAAVLKLVHSHGGQVDASVLCSKLYSEHADYQALAKKAGGVKGLCKINSNGLQFHPAVKGSGCVSLMIATTMHTTQNAVPNALPDVECKEPKKTSRRKGAAAKVKHPSTQSQNNKPEQVCNVKPPASSGANTTDDLFE